MECVAADDVKDRLKDVTDEYHELSSRCHSLGDRLADLSGKHRQFNDSAFKLLGWLTETEDQLASLKQEAGSPEPAQLQNQLDRLKSLSMDALSHRGLLDEMQRRGQDLTNRYTGFFSARCWSCCFLFNNCVLFISMVQIRVRIHGMIFCIGCAHVQRDEKK